MGKKNKKINLGKFHQAVVGMLVQLLELLLALEAGVAQGRHLLAHCWQVSPTLKTRIQICNKNRDREGGRGRKREREREKKEEREGERGC
jgi:hypothetical protein